MQKPEVTVIDYGVGNLLSVQRGLEQCGAKVLLTSDADLVLQAEKVVLPGVGAFGNAMAALHRLKLVEPIRAIAARGTPLLGICLGMQLLMDESEEFGLTPGLGVIPGRVVALPHKTSEGLSQKIPHIGWNGLLPAAEASWNRTLLEHISSGDAVYFVHSFEAAPADPAHYLANCIYGGHSVAAVIQSGCTVGCQFHPEKSGRVGLKILRNFCVN